MWCSQVTAAQEAALRLEDDLDKVHNDLENERNSKSNGKTLRSPAMAPLAMESPDAQSSKGKVAQTPLSGQSHASVTTPKAGRHSETPIQSVQALQALQGMYYIYTACSTLEQWSFFQNWIYIIFGIPWS